MAVEYDGQVTIKTALDTSGFVAGEKDLENAARQAVSKVEGIGVAARNSLNKRVESLSKANEAYRRQTETVEALREELDKLRGEKVESEEYKGITKEIEQTDAALDKVADKIDKMVALYGVNKVEGMKSFQALQYELEILQEKFTKLRAEREDMEENGTAFIPADTSVASARLEAAEKKHDEMLDALNEKYKTLRENIDKMRNTATDGHKKVAEEGEKASERVAKASKVSFKKVVMYAFGVQSLFAAFRKLKSIASEGLKTLAQFDPQFNSTMSRFVTGLQQIKLDIATMVQPLVQTIVPIITAVIERLHNALLQVANVVAAIMGQDYIDVATAQMQDYSGALDNVASSAKEASKALGGYDKLNVISGGESGGGVGGALGAIVGGGAGNGKVQNVEQVPVKVADAMKQVVEVTKEAQTVTEEYFEAYEEGGARSVLQKFVKNAKYTFSHLGDLLGIEVEKGSLVDKLLNWVNPTRNGGEVYREGTVEKWWRETKVGVADFFGIDDILYDIGANPELEKAAEGAAKKFIARFNKTSQKETTPVVDYAFPKTLTPNLSNKVKNFAGKVGTAFSNFFSINSDTMGERIADAGTEISVSNSVANASRAIGEALSQGVVSAFGYNDADMRSVADKTSRLVSAVEGSKPQAEQVGKSVAESINKGINDALAKQSDGKIAADSITKGLQAVQAEASNSGSALNNALQGVGKKISEGINKGTISVPITFTGQATPTAVSPTAVQPKVNTTVTIYLDKRKITEAVIDEAAKIRQQVGGGVQAGINYIYGV